VCPWNRDAAFSDDPAWQARPGLAFPHLTGLANMSDAEWRKKLIDSPLRRARLRRLRRTLAYALGSSPDAEADDALAAMAEEPSAADPIVAEAIQWARERRTCHL
jgi:epoxyqueuosine reductase